MKRGISLLLLVLGQFAVQAQEKPWSLVRERIVTPWAEQVDVNAPLPEYPRPQLVRNNNWKNLNGLWHYAIAGVLSPLLSHHGLHLALGMAGFTLLGWLMWRWVARVSRGMPSCPRESAALEPTDHL